MYFTADSLIDIYIYIYIYIFAQVILPYKKVNFKQYGCDKR